MDGLRLAALYAYPPNRLGYCGADSYRSALRRYLGGDTGDAGAQELEFSLKRFRAHYAYLRLIAEAGRKKPFDLEVVRAFWTGSRLLSRIGREPLALFVRDSLFGGRNARRAKTLSENLPPGILPHHSFNSLYVNFVSDSVGRNPANYDSCCITPARVLSAGNRTIEAVRLAVVRDGAYALSPVECTISLSHRGLRLAGDVREGDVVSCHWGMAVEKLKPAHTKNLISYTLRNIRAVNRMNKPKRA